MDWYPQPMFTPEQAAAGAAFLENKCAFVKKARFGHPKPCLRLNRRPQALFVFLCLSDMPFLKKVCLGQQLTIFNNI